MTARSLTLAAVFAMPFSFSGCAKSDTPPKPERRPTPELETPKNEPEKSGTVAHLLIGRWRVVNSRGMDISPQSEVITAFDSDGRFTITTKDVASETQIRTGVYNVDKYTIKLSSDPRENDPGIKWDLKIDTLTETTLVTIFGSGPKEERSQMVRIAAK